MAIMRGNNSTSGKVVEDNMPRDIESRDLARPDKKDPPYRGISDKFNYGGNKGS